MEDKNLLNINPNSIDNFVNKYPNIKTQIDLGIKLQGDQNICLFIETKERKYFPVSFEINNFGNYVLKPLFVLHGVGGVEPFEDLKEIVLSGFKALSAFSIFPEKHLDNVYVLNYNPFSNDCFEIKYDFVNYGNKSVMDKTKGDSYFLHMHLLEQSGCIPSPRNFINYFSHGTLSCDTDNFSVIILLNPELSNTQTKERINLYKHELKYKDISFINGPIKEKMFVKFYTHPIGGSGKNHLSLYDLL